MRRRGFIASIIAAIWAPFKKFKTRPTLDEVIATSNSIQESKVCNDAIFVFVPLQNVTDKHYETLGTGTLHYGVS